MEPTRSKYSEEKLQELTQKVIDLCLSKEGNWVQIDKNHSEVNQQEVFNRVRDVFKIMGIKYSIPEPELLRGRTIHYYKIKVMTEGQLILWRQERKRTGPFSERYGWIEPEWHNDYRSF